MDYRLRRTDYGFWIWDYGFGVRDYELRSRYSMGSGCLPSVGYG